MARDRNREYVYGNNAVMAVLDTNAGNRKIYKLFIKKNKKRSPIIKSITDLCRKKNVQVIEQDGHRFDSYFEPHLSRLDLESAQGIILEVSPYNYYDLDHYLNSQTTGKSFLIMLDGVTDVGNFGSVLRNCSAFGADGIIVAKNRSVQVNQRVAKTSAGALEKVRVFRVTNLARTMEKLKDNQFWVYGSQVENAESIQKAPLNFPLVMVMGSEFKGISALIAKKCDYLVRIDMSQNIQSLNVSVASGIIMYWIYKGLKS
ncbi:MAG: 23S rRNA (guanosine(2251)-2'-O)-methyltransferase RlmB [Actinomycetia bacterium]|nr:23S rRNA (guanosine(2251)-2'-O)-methyltransferase RlmB [Actinomycetes bacterium]